MKISTHGYEVLSRDSAPLTGWVGDQGGRLRMKESLYLKDIILVPQYSELSSRSSVDVGWKWGEYGFSFPIISSPMSTITDLNMAFAMYCSGGLGILHRFSNKREDWATKITSYPIDRAAAFSPSDKDGKAYWLGGFKFLVLDVAHGYTSRSLDAIKWAKDNFLNSLVMSGNVVTGEAALASIDAGADGIRCGIGQGSVCKTTDWVGCGRGSATALMDIVEAVDGRVPVFLDGGVKNAGDVVKALALGATAVISGRLFAGTNEAAGERSGTELSARPMKRYAGMASLSEQEKFKGPGDPDIYEEGVEEWVPYTGPVSKVIEKLTRQIKSGFSYMGAKNLQELWQKSKWEVLR